MTVYSQPAHSVVAVVIAAAAASASAAAAAASASAAAAAAASASAYSGADVVLHSMNSQRLLQLLCVRLSQTSTVNLQAASSTGICQSHTQTPHHVRKILKFLASHSQMAFLCVYFGTQCGVYTILCA